VGFDRLFNLLEAGTREDDGHPPFDIMKDGEDSYRITIAVAGFKPEDIEVVAQQNQLIVSGKRSQDGEEGNYIHRGIATRAFERRFQLADFVEAGEASFEHGLLSIALRRVVPEAMKPRRYRSRARLLSRRGSKDPRIRRARRPELSNRRPVLDGPVSLERTISSDTGRVARVRDC
jgi:molecular chaperone IbpA